MTEGPRSAVHSELYDDKPAPPIPGEQERADQKQREALIESAITKFVRWVLRKLGIPKKP